MTPKPRLRAYTTRSFPDDLLKRLRVLAAYESARRNERVTLEQMVADAVRRGITEIEKEILR